MLECLCLSCNRFMLRSSKDTWDAEVLRYLWSKGTLGAEELRKRGTAERAGPDKEHLVGPSRARTKLD